MIRLILPNSSMVTGIIGMARDERKWSVSVGMVVSAPRVEVLMPGTKRNVFSLSSRCDSSMEVAAILVSFVESMMPSVLGRSSHWVISVSWVSPERMM